MKPVKKLRVVRERMRALTSAQLAVVAGGTHVEDVQNGISH